MVDLLADFGETVTLLDRGGAEADPLGLPSGGEEREEVGGVLVSFTANALSDDARPDGQRVDATLYFPEGFDRDVSGMDVLVRGARHRVEWCRPAPARAVVPYGVTAGAVRSDG